MILNQYASAKDIIEAGGIAELIEKTSNQPVDTKVEMGVDMEVDIVLLDIELPGTDGINGIETILKYQPHTKIIMLSATVNATKIDHARERGALGFLHKSASTEQIIDAINEVLAGGTSFDQNKNITDSFRSISRPGTKITNLTSRQQEVLRPLCEGLSNRAIAQRMGLSENTVRIHVSAILRAFQAINRSEVILIAQREGMID